MVTMKLRTTLLICIIQGVLSATLKLPAGKVTSAQPTNRAIATNSTTKMSKKTALNSKLSGVPIELKELDGRSAYVNNQYIDDEEPPPAPYNDTSPPLYQFLQEQMEHILATSLPGEYQLQNNQANTEASAVEDDLNSGMMINGYGGHAMQSNMNSPVFGYENREIQDPFARGEENSENSYQFTMPTKPATLELPKPIKVGTIIASDVSLQPESLATTKSTINTNTSVESSLPTGGYGSQHVPSQSQPTLPSAPTQLHKTQVLADSSYDAKLQNYHKSHIKQAHSSTPSKYTYVHENSTLHMRKRRITFKTISTSSQVISTPLADLLFKFSIGMAKPSTQAVGNSLYVQDGEPMRNTITTGCNDKLNQSKHMQ